MSHGCLISQSHLCPDGWVLVSSSRLVLSLPNQQLSVSSQIFLLWVTKNRSGLCRPSLWKPGGISTSTHYQKKQNSHQQNTFSLIMWISLTAGLFWQFNCGVLFLRTFYFWMMGVPSKTWLKKIKRFSLPLFWQRGGNSEPLCLFIYLCFLGQFIFLLCRLSHGGHLVRLWFPLPTDTTSASMGLATSRAYSIWHLIFLSLGPLQLSGRQRSQVPAGNLLSVTETHVPGDLAPILYSLRTYPLPNYPHHAHTNDIAHTYTHTYTNTLYHLYNTHTHTHYTCPYYITYKTHTCTHRIN